LPARFIFSDEATCHINVKVDWHEVLVWGTENPHVTLEHEKGSPEVNMLCAILKERFYGSLFFVENTIMCNSHT
jgi:hypothetical protein